MDLEDLQIGFDDLQNANSKNTDLEESNINDVKSEIKELRDKRQFSNY